MGSGACRVLFHMEHALNTTPQPGLVMSVRDVRRLEALLATPAVAGSDVAERLEAEIARADVREPGEIPADVVTMNSNVSVLDESSGVERTVRVVYPHDAGGGEACVSVLAPVGAALLGLRVGDAIDWPLPGGRTTRLRLTRVHYQPEAAGLPE